MQATIRWHTACTQPRSYPDWRLGVANDPLDINDSDRSTQGGPPGWMAFAIIVAAAVMIGVAVIVYTLVF